MKADVKVGSGRAGPRWIVYLMQMREGYQAHLPFDATEFVAVLPGHEQPTTPGSLQRQERVKRSCDAAESKTKLGMALIPALRKQKQAAF